MTDELEPVPPLARVAMPNVEQHGYRAYPLVDHIADKLAATFDRYGDSQTPRLGTRTSSTSSRS